jgi:hypothetical protein
LAFEDAAGCPACLSLSLPRGDGDRGEGEGEMKDELKLVVEHAMKELRVLLKPDELQHYEELYKTFKSSSDEAKRAAAFEILKKHLSETGMMITR